MIPGLQKTIQVSPADLPGQPAALPEQDDAAFAALVAAAGPGGAHRPFAQGKAQTVAEEAQDAVATPVMTPPIPMPQVRVPVATPITGEPAVSSPPSVPDGPARAAPPRW